METHDPNVYLTILGGVSRGFLTPFLDLGARSAIFWHLKMGTLMFLQLKWEVMFDRKYADLMELRGK